MSQETVSVASLNTLHGEVIRQDGLGPVANKDILMLQEVSTHRADGLEHKLAASGYRLAAVAGCYGLALAVSEESGIRPMPDTVRTCYLQDLSLAEKFFVKKHLKRPHEFSGRGMLATKFETPGGLDFTVATVHLAVLVNRFRRENQAIMMALELLAAYYDGPLVAGGDMNHWPSPTKVDIQAWQDARLTPVGLNGSPTWRAQGKEQVRQLRALSLLPGVKLPADPYSAYLDSLLYRDIDVTESGVIEVDGTDHTAIYGEFAFKP